MSQGAILSRQPFPRVVHASKEGGFEDIYVEAATSQPEVFLEAGRAKREKLKAAPRLGC